MFLLFHNAFASSLSYFSTLHSNMFLLFPQLSALEHLSQLYLHSNMFLLFLSYAYLLELWKRIYIPICFYYFVNINFCIIYIIEIYIPICFYYFVLDSARLWGVRTFTFQYVSIISHSVCTSFHCSGNLHSNMFLLFQTNRSKFVKRK